MRDTLQPTQLSIGGSLLVNYIMPLASSLLGRPVCIIDEAKITKLFVTNKEIESVFGPQDQILNMVSLSITETNKAKFTPLGRFFRELELRKGAELRLSVMKYVIAHPEIQKVQIKSPLVILGLFRSGTTLLHRLLAQDPKARAFKLWEMISVYDEANPPPTEETYENHQNIAKAEQILNLAWWLFPNFLSEYNYAAATEYDEEFSCDPSTPRALAMLRNQPFMLQANLYMKRFFQMMLFGFPTRTHLVLKFPGRCDSLPAFVSVFPDARFVTINRDVRQVVPSATLLMYRSISNKLEANSVNAREFGEGALKHAVGMTRSLAAFRGLVAANNVKLMPNLGLDQSLKDHNVSPSQFIDIEYTDLISDPINVVHRIYSYFGMTVSEEFEAAMKMYLLENPNGKHVKSKVDANAMFGFTEDSIMAAFEE
ncbi:hypothetical protein HDU79_000250 [Rhizoclosmatium sp. JEL0117]|nr:hypothetical protein HDU79_000250 [Rhizoclosmatium sp. JEL0117]